MTKPEQEKEEYGIDEKRREILTHIEGETGNYP